MGLLLSLSGDCFVTRAAFSAFERLVERIFLFRGSTAPVVGAVLGARPFLGRVLACRCFFPNLFFSRAICLIAFRRNSANTHYREPGLMNFKMPWRVSETSFSKEFDS
jgi:hypothetical protein